MASAWNKIRSTAQWLPAYFWQRATRWSINGGPPHLIVALADHFEPAIIPHKPDQYASRDVQEERLERWCREYPLLVDRWRDEDGRPFPHTYFYPAEQYDCGLIERLVEHCRAGWGEVEIHLHHGARAPDSPGNTRRALTDFRNALEKHGCLSRLDDQGPPRYAFVHGNFALANSGIGGCGVDSEMQILADTGCYADFTLPSAPNPSQVAKINALYECSLPLDQRAPHRRGRDLRCGHSPSIFPLIIQGPIALDFERRNGRRLPVIENAALTKTNPPTMHRLKLWRRASIMVQGRPDWVFIKLHCHGMDPWHEEAMLGAPMQRFLEEAVAGQQGGKAYHLHFVTAREMVNIALAACERREGNPGEYRDYRFRRAGR
ncbi:MAG: hypothetical protein ACRD1O_08615 [Terriglobia bacterium]